VTFEDIEAMLGTDVVADVHSAVMKAAAASREKSLAPESQTALEELLTALLANVIAARSEQSMVRRRAIACADQLEDAVSAALVLSKVPRRMPQSSRHH